MTNNNDKFHQRWEFRRREVDEDTSSDDSRSNSNNHPITDLVLLENDEKVDTPQVQRHDTIEPKTVEASEKKIKSSKKKNVVKKKPKGKRNLNTTTSKGVVMFKDLKIFADSLINELTVDRENMFAHMREEMGKFVASSKSSTLKPIKTNLKCYQKKKAPSKTGTKSSVIPMDKNAITNVVKNNRALEMSTKAELHKGDVLRLSTIPSANLANGSSSDRVVSSSSDRVVSSSYLTLPTVVSKPQLQNQRNLVPSGIEIGKLQTEERLFGSFSNVYHKSMGLLGQNFSQTASLPVGFPIPLNQKMENGSNLSGLSYCENSLADNSKAHSKMNNGSIVRFPMGTPPSSERVFFPNGMSTFVPRKSDGEFMSLRPHDIKDGQFYRASLRKEN